MEQKKIEITINEIDNETGLSDIRLPALDDMQNKLNEILIKSEKAPIFPPRWSIEAVIETRTLCEEYHAYLTQILEEVKEANKILSADDTLPTDEIIALDNEIVAVITQCQQLEVAQKPRSTANA